MATNTPNLNLRKPSEADDVDVELDLNANYDIVDGLALQVTKIFHLTASHNHSLTTFTGTGLLFPAVSGESYKFRFFILYDVGELTDGKYRIDYPSGTILIGSQGFTINVAQGGLGLNPTADNIKMGGEEATGSGATSEIEVGGKNSGDVDILWCGFEGIFECTSSGNVQLQSAVVNDTGNPITTRKGSHIEVIRFV